MSPQNTPRLALKLTTLCVAAVLLGVSQVKAGTMTDLGFLPGGYYSYANAVSGDGSVIIGRSTVMVGNSLQTHDFKYAGGIMTDLGTLTGGYDLYSGGLPPPGAVIFGYSNVSIGGSRQDHAFKYTGPTPTDPSDPCPPPDPTNPCTNSPIGVAVPFPGFTGTIRTASGDINSDSNNVIIGNHSVLGTGELRRLHAFKYTGNTLTDLGTLRGGNTSNATGISASGDVIVGSSSVLVGGSLRTHAFKYTGTTMTDLGTLPGGDDSSAFGISAGGDVNYTPPPDASRDVIYGSSSVLVGGSLRTHAFKYTGTTMTDLGTLPGGDTSYPFGISADGAAIFGYSNVLVGGSLQTHAFKYTGTTMTDLGTLPGGNYSYAQGISRDGAVIVGSSNVSIGGSIQTHAFKYVGDKMTDLGTLGGNSSYAIAVSADGSVIVGEADDANGYTRAFLYANATMLDIPVWMASVNGSRAVYATAAHLFTLTLEGAHHRTLMSYDTMGKESQAWVTGDFGSSSRKVNSSVASGEAGVAKTFAPGLMAGIAFGTAQQNGDLAFGGSSHLSGNYVLGEVDYLLPDKQSIVSIIVALGRYDADFNRGYDTGSGTQYSAGSTSVQMRTVRLRFDGPAYGVGLGFSVSPYISYAASRSSADAYTETGGSFPAEYNALSHTAQEGRLGLAASKQLNESTKVRFSAELIHRFDGSAPSLTGTDITNSLAFSAPGVAPTRNQARVGLDVDHKLSADTLINFSLHLAGVGEAPDVSGALSIRRAF